MVHFHLFFNFIVFSVGILADSISFFLYKKYKLDIYKYYCVFLFLFTLIYIADFFDFYFYHFFDDYSLIIKIIFLYIKIISSAFTIYIIPFLFFKLYKKDIKLFQKIIFSIIVLIAILWVFVTIFIKSDLKLKIQYLNYEFMILSIVRIIVIIYVVILGLPLYKEAESLGLILFYRALLSVTGIVIFFNISGGIINYFIQSLRNVNFISGHSFVYFIWNLVSICFVYWYFIHRIDSFKVKEKLDIISNDYKITEREKEIIFLISQGYSNNDIGNKLFVSLSTTKTHIRNIFRKMNIKSRMELLNLLKS